MSGKDLDARRSMSEDALQGKAGREMPHTLRDIILSAGILLLAAPLAAGRGHFEKRAAKKGWDYPKLGRYTFIEDSKDYGRLTLGVSVELAMWRLQDDMLPLVFILASERGPDLDVETQRFRLRLPDGSVLDPVPYAELVRRGYRAELVHDWARLRGSNPTHGWFSTGYRLVPSRLYPDPRSAQVLMEGVEVGGDRYATDLIYFPNPGGIAGEELQLVYEDPDSGRGREVERRIEVTFVIPDPRADGEGAGRPQTRPQTRRSSSR